MGAAQHIGAHADAQLELRQLQSEIDALRAQVERDRLRIQALEAELDRARPPATATPNVVARLAFEQAFHVEQSRAKRNRSGLCLALFEADLAAGATTAAIHETTSDIVEIVSTAIRPTDLLANISERESALLLTTTALDQAMAAVSRLQRVVADRRVLPANEQRSFCAGIVQWRHDESLSDLLDRALHALQMAKAGGPHRLVVA